MNLVWCTTEPSIISWAPMPQKARKLGLHCLHLILSLHLNVPPNNHSLRHFVLSAIWSWTHLCTLSLSPASEKSMNEVNLGEVWLVFIPEKWRRWWGENRSAENRVKPGSAVAGSERNRPVFGCGSFSALKILHFCPCSSGVLPLRTSGSLASRALFFKNEPGFF